jgi:mycothiol synthase
MDSSNQQVQMIWPVESYKNPPTVNIPADYKIRTFQVGDESDFFALMALAGWLGWDERTLQPWLYRILPDGWYMIIHESSNRIVATCMATHDPTWIVPYCGELAWLAGDPAHSGKGLGSAAVAAVTTKFLQNGYKVIHLYTEPFRLAALKIYLKLGYKPFLDTTESTILWEQICTNIHWAFTPNDWIKRYPS